MQKFDTTAPITTVLEIPAGRVRIIAADRTDTTVEINPANPGKSRDVKAAEQATVEYSAGILRITAAKGSLLGPTGSIEVTVQLPTASSIEAKSAAAELRAVGRLGEVTFEGAYHEIKLDEAAAVHLTATDGDIEIGRLTGPAEVSTARGDIRIAEAIRGALVLTTQSGDIAVGVAAATAATLDAGTSHGRINNALLSPANAPDRLNIQATTTNGDITARHN